MKIAGKISTVFLISILLLSLVKSNILYTIYQYDTGLFTQLFCENKQKPQLNCNGKCKLAQLQREQDNKDATETLNRLQVENVYCNNIEPLHVLNSSITLIDKPASYYCCHYHFLFTRHLSKPPNTGISSAFVG